MENQKPNNPSAFPSERFDKKESERLGGTCFTDYQKGMTLRDYFANSAMQSIITRLGGSPFVDSNEQDTFEIVAKESYKYADAMLKQRQLNND
jgi:hypothetical protein